MDITDSNVVCAEDYYQRTFVWIKEEPDNWSSKASNASTNNEDDQLDQLSFRDDPSKYKKPFECAHCGHKTFFFSRIYFHILEHIKTSGLEDKQKYSETKEMLESLPAKRSQSDFGENTPKRRLNSIVEKLQKSTNLGKKPQVADITQKNATINQNLTSSPSDQRVSRILSSSSVVKTGDQPKQCNEAPIFLPQKIKTSKIPETETVSSKTRTEGNHLKNTNKENIGCTFLTEPRISKNAVNSLSKEIPIQNTTDYKSQIPNIPTGKNRIIVKEDHSKNTYIGRKFSTESRTSKEESILNNAVNSSSKEIPIQNTADYKSQIPNISTCQNRTTKENHLKNINKEIVGRKFSSEPRISKEESRSTNDCTENAADSLSKGIPTQNTTDNKSQISNIPPCKNRMTKENHLKNKNKEIVGCKFSSEPRISKEESKLTNDCTENAADSLSKGIPTQNTTDNNSQISNIPPCKNGISTKEDHLKTTNKQIIGRMFSTEKMISKEDIKLNNVCTKNAVNFLTKEIPIQNTADYKPQIASTPPCTYRTITKEDRLKNSNKENIGRPFSAEPKISNEDSKFKNTCSENAVSFLTKEIQKVLDDKPQIINTPACTSRITAKEDLLKSSNKENMRRPTDHEDIRLKSGHRNNMTNSSVKDVQTDTKLNIAGNPGLPSVSDGTKIQTLLKLEGVQETLVASTETKNGVESQTCRVAESSVISSDCNTSKDSSSPDDDTLRIEIISSDYETSENGDSSDDNRMVVDTSDGDSSESETSSDDDMSIDTWTSDEKSENGNSPDCVSPADKRLKRRKVETQRKETNSPVNKKVKNFGISPHSEYSKNDVVLPDKVKNERFSNDYEVSMDEQRSIVFIKSEIDLNDNGTEGNKQEFICYHCGHKTSTLKRLKKHILDKHFGEMLYICRFCMYSSPSSEELNKHLYLRHSKPKNFSCTICGFKCQTQKHLDKHLKSRHEPDKSFKCPECDYSTQMEGVLKDHLKLKHLGERNFRCDFCSFSTITEDRLRKHVNCVHLGKKPYRCPLCEYSAYSSESVRIHVQGVHYKIKDFKCSYCDYSAIRLVHLREHMDSVHLKLKPFKCEHCSYRVGVLRKLRKHVDAVHLKVKRFYCTSCDYASVRSDALKDHVACHHSDEMPFACEECDFRAPTKTKLSQHVLFKHKEKGFICGECNFQTKLSHLLKEHMMCKHRNEKPFRCKECNFRTVNAQNLRRHVDSNHLEQKPYPCNQCDYRAGRPQHLKLHQQARHAAQKPFQCTLCPYSAVQEGHVKKHLQAKHLKTQPW